MDMKLDQEKYFLWAKKYLGIDYQNSKVKQYYELNTIAALTYIQQSDYFGRLVDFLLSCNKTYYSKYKHSLFMSDNSIDLVSKPFKSIINKSYRFNCLWNDRFPEKPKKNYPDYIRPENWFELFNDIIRCTLVCKYADGPQWLCNQIEGFTKKYGYNCNYYSQQKEEGYYAFHFYWHHPLTLSRIDFSEYDLLLKVEIQITTQMQEILRNLTHEHYENERIAIKPFDNNWKWNLKSDRFKTGYMSHTLHLLEAIIVELRDKQSHF